MTPLPPVTVVLPIHTERRWEVFVASVDALRRQDPAPAAIVVSVDHNLPLLKRIADRFPDLMTVENQFSPGASGTRNSGALVAETPLIAFVDSDIVVHDGWLQPLLGPFADPSVVGTGGFVAPRWPSGPPEWFPDEFGWVVGVSYRGLPTITSPVRNVWSCNMAVRREAFSSVQGFRIEYSKVDNSPKSEDTDFCMRVAERSGGGVWMFVPEAIAEHEIGLARSRFKFFVLRCFAEGKAKVELAHLDGGRRELLDESAYMRHAAPASAGRYARMALIHRDSASLRRGAAIIAGLIAATLGAIVGEAFNLTHGSSVRTA